MWWNGRFATWMCSRQICSNCVMLSCQYGPKSLRNVSNTLLNLCHEELRQFWRQKGVQPGTSKVYLIKWPVSVYMYMYVTFLEAIRGLGNTVACQLDASSEDCLDVFDLKQRCLDRSIHHVSSKSCEGYKRADVSLCFLSLFDAIHRLIFKSKAAFTLAATLLLHVARGWWWGR